MLLDDIINIYGLTDDTLQVVNHKNIDNFSALNAVCILGYEDLALKLLKIDGIDYNTFNNYNRSALFYCIRNKMITVAEKLLDMPDIDYNACDIDGNTIFIEACEYMLPSIIKTLNEI